MTETRRGWGPRKCRNFCTKRNILVKNRGRTKISKVYFSLHILTHQSSLTHTVICFFVCKFEIFLHCNDFVRGDWWVYFPEDLVFPGLPWIWIYPWIYPCVDIRLRQYPWIFMDTYRYFYVTALELAPSQNHNKTKQNRLFVGQLVLVLNLS